MDAGGWPDVRWMRVVEHGGDRNEDARRRRDVEEKGEEMEEGEEDEKKEERRERKGVRVRVRLGVGGAIRNYCGTIDKRRLRGRTTEDSLRPSDFPSTVASLFRLFSLFPGSLGLPLLASCRSLRTVPCPRNLPDSSICNVRKPARYAILVRPFYVE